MGTSELGEGHTPLTPQPVLYLGSDPSFPATAACLFKHLPCFVLSFLEQTFVRSLLYTSTVIPGAVDTMGESPPSALMQLTLTRGKLGGAPGRAQETNKQVHKQRKQFPPRGSRGQEASAQAAAGFLWEERFAWWEGEDKTSSAKGPRWEPATFSYVICLASGVQFWT